MISHFGKADENQPNSRPFSAHPSNLTRPGAISHLSPNNRSNKVLWKLAAVCKPAMEDRGGREISIRIMLGIAHNPPRTQGPRKVCPPFARLCASQNLDGRPQTWLADDIDVSAEFVAAACSRLHRKAWSFRTFMYPLRYFSNDRRNSS